MRRRCRDCPVCDSPPGDGDFIGTLDVNHANRENLGRQRYDLTYCSCGALIYLSPLPPDADIRAMYAESRQFAEHGGADSPYRGEQAIAVLEYITGRLLAILRWQRIDTAQRFKVLEIGAGLGWMCRAAKIVSWDNLTVALDLSDETVAECRWVDHYFVEDLFASRTVDAYAPYDVISLTHVFEHLTDPLAMLERLRGLLSDRGLVFITAPHRPAAWTRHAGVEAWEGWSYHHTPAHLHYFSRASFERAAAAANLELVFWDDHHEDGQAFEAWLQHPADG